MCIDGITLVKFMGHNLGQLISKFGAKLRDIDINKMTVSLIKHTACNHHCHQAEFTEMAK